MNFQTIAAVLLLASSVDAKRKKATKFKEYQPVELSDDIEKDYAAFLKVHHPHYVPDQHHAER
jgi:hypothetical protein